MRRGRQPHGLANPAEAELRLRHKPLRIELLSDRSASSTPAEDPLALLQSQLPQVRERIRQLQELGDRRSSEQLFEEYREWLCPMDPHSDLLLMRRLAEE